MQKVLSFKDSIKLMNTETIAVYRRQFLNHGELLRAELYTF